MTGVYLFLSAFFIFCCRGAEGFTRFVSLILGVLFFLAAVF